MFSTSDTIVAIATPPGRGGIGVVRISGPDATRVASQLVTLRGGLEPRRATLTTVRLKPDSATGPRTVPGDHIVATYFDAPHSYTGEHVVELSAHGSPVVLRAIVQAATAAGARLAEPGEFTLRAFLNGRIDLVQAEAVGDLIDAVTPLQARAAFDQLQGTLTRAIGEIDAALFDLVARLEASVDFPDEGYHFLEPQTLLREIDHLLTRTTALLADARRGRMVREGLQVAIVGKPNVGKSSLFNALVGCSRAIVTDLPGTTRDLVTEVVDMSGLRITLVDTAGRREAQDPVEAEGVARSRRAQSVSDLTLVVVDGSRGANDSDREIIDEIPEKKRLIVSTKCDMPRGPGPCGHELVGAVRVSAVTAEGLGELGRRVAAMLDVEPDRDRPEITNVRHIALVQQAHAALARTRTALAEHDGALSEEFVLADLQAARAALEEISGKRVGEDLLAHIFSRFCVGK